MLVVELYKRDTQFTTLRCVNKAQGMTKIQWQKNLARDQINKIIDLVIRIYDRLIISIDGLNYN